MELKQLQQLLVISKCGTLSKASTELLISQPALSRSMQKLEEELQVELFDHYKNKLVLNDTGKLMVSYASKLLDDADTMIHETQNYYNRISKLVVGACSPAPVWDIAPMIENLYHESVTCEVICNKELIEHLKNKHCDLVITRTEEQDEEIICLPYLTETLMLSVGKEDPLYEKDIIHYDDLKGITMLMYENNGFWSNHHNEHLPDTKFIYQKDRSTFLQIKQASSLPCFTTNLSLKREGNDVNRKVIPIDEESTQVDFYLCMLKKDKKKYKTLIEEVNNYYDY